MIAANPKAVADYRAGRPVVGFFVGQVMKATGGAADAARVTTLVRERLDGRSNRRWGWCASRSSLAGVALIVVGALRAREPYRRYMALKEQDANVARYEAWRGGAARTEDRRVGGDAGAPPPGADRRGHRDRRGRARVPGFIVR